MQMTIRRRYCARRSSERRDVAELHLRRDGVGVVALQCFLKIRQSGLNGTSFTLTNLRAMLGKRFLGRVYQSISMILGFDRRLALLVFLGMRFGVLDHLLDLGFRKSAGSLDADLLLLAGRLVPGLNIDDAVSVDVE